MLPPNVKAQKQAFGVSTHETSIPLERMKNETKAQPFYNKGTRSIEFQSTTKNQRHSVDEALKHKGTLKGI